MGSIIRPRATGGKVTPRQEASENLQAIGRPALPYLVKWMKGDHFRTAEQYRDFYNWLPAFPKEHLPEPVIRVLAKLVADQDQHGGRGNAANKLGQFAERARPALPAFLEATKDTDSRIRRLATFAIFHIDQQIVVENKEQLMRNLIEALDDADIYDAQKRAAIECMEVFDEIPDEAVKALTRMANDSHSAVQGMANRALRKFE